MSKRRHHYDARFSVAAPLTRRSAIRGAVAAGGLVGSRLRFVRAQSDSLLPASPAPTSLSVEELTIDALRAGYRDKAFTVQEVVEASLQRIRQLDDAGPTLNAMIELNPQAPDIADVMDRELEVGISRGPLHGVPVVLKDVLITEDNMLTTAGSVAMTDNIATRDAFVVRLLRRAGTIILGKTNMSEWSNWRGVAADGWSSRGGQSVNPYATDYSAGGSSTGSAIAAAASYAVAGIGAETDGSIIAPAAACGVVGLKPTAGLVSRSGALSLTFSMDSIGPMTRTVTDAAYVMNAMAGRDPEDPYHGDFAAFAPAGVYGDPGSYDFVAGLDAGALRGARIGVARPLFAFGDIVNGMAETAVEAMRSAGATIIDDVTWDAIYELVDGVAEGAINVGELPFVLQYALDNYLTEGPIRTLNDIVEYYWNNPGATLYDPNGDAIDFLYNQPTDTPYQAWYQMQLAETLTLARDNGIDAIMDALSLDALVAPAASLATPLADGIGAYASSQMAAIAGYPVITVPIGFREGLPVGLAIFGRGHADAHLLRYAYALEQTLNARRPPAYGRLPDPTISAV